jgi:hypothetical protein
MPLKPEHIQTLGKYCAEGTCADVPAVVNEWKNLPKHKVVENAARLKEVLRDRSDEPGRAGDDAMFANIAMQKVESDFK